MQAQKRKEEHLHYQGGFTSWQIGEGELVTLEGGKYGESGGWM